MKKWLLALMVPSLVHFAAQAAPSCFPGLADRKGLDVAEQRALSHSKANAPAACRMREVQCHFDVSRTGDEGILVVTEVAIVEGGAQKCLFPLHAGQANIYDRNGKYVRAMPFG